MTLVEAHKAFWRGEPEELVLRDYQQESLDELRAALQGGQPQVLCAPTGSGKTVVAAHMLRRARDEGKRALFICDRIALVNQTSAALGKFGIPHGVLQGDRISGRGAEIMVCSAQTLERRNFWPRANLVIIDEAHTLRKKTTSFIQSTGAQVVGLTATPFTEGLADVYSGVVNTATTNSLIQSGWIVPLRVYTATEINMEGAKTTGGEWQAGEVERRGQAIVGDIVSEWQRRTADQLGGPAKTLVFSATVAHGESICEQFQKAGFDFRQVSYLDRDLRERAQLIDAFRRGEVQGLVSVDALAKGFDVPDVRVLIGARPYRKSFAAHIQQIGRVMRSAPGKDFGLVLDHAGNFSGFADRTAHFFEYGVQGLKRAKERYKGVRKEGVERPVTTCRCGMVFNRGDEYCLGCGEARPRRQNTVRSLPGKLSRVSLKAAAPPKNPKEEWRGHEEWVWRQMCTVATRKYPDNQPRARKLALAQFRQLFGEWPGRQFEPLNEEPDIRVATIITLQLRKFWREANKRQA